MRKVRGFTLIELMVVLAIMGAVIATAMPYLSSRNSETKKILRELTVLSREMHTKAKLQGVIFRLVIDMGEEVGGKRTPQSYWVEKGSGKTVLRSDEEDRAKEAAKEAADHKGDSDKKFDPRAFDVDHSMIKQPRQLPRGMSFEKVEISRLKAPISNGKAFIHYLPQGLVDEAAIHIKGEKKEAWTITIHPLTGKAELIAKPISLQEIKSQ